jgi:large subunit ribosomal protein L31
MKQGIHPKWFPNARVVCACGNTWTVGATVPQITTDVCYNCHPFYTGEQRIVDTEGQVDRFIRRLERRSDIVAQQEARRKSLTSPDQPITEIDLSARYVKALQNAGVINVGDLLARLSQGGDQALLEIDGFGRVALIETKKKLRARGFTWTEPEAAPEPAPAEEA